MSIVRKQSKDYIPRWMRKLPKVDIFGMRCYNTRETLELGQCRAFLPDSPASSRPNLPPPIFVKERWITCDNEDVFWFPSEHQLFSVAVHGSTLAFGCQSGRVSFIDFVFQSFPWPPCPLPLKGMCFYSLSEVRWVTMANDADHELD